jgi:hypothetical protein
MPANYDYKRLIGYFVRASSTNGLPVMTDRQPGTELTGAAPVFACRAWVNFNGTGTVAIRGSGNVSSITDLGTGDYRVNLATAMPDANYAAVISGGQAGAVRSASSPGSSANTASQVYIYGASGTTATDIDYLQLAIFR